MKVKCFLLSLLASLALGFIYSGAAFAAAPDFSTLTAAVDFSTVISGLLVIFAGLAGAGIIWTGGGIIVAKIFGGKR